MSGTKREVPDFDRAFKKGQVFRLDHEEAVVGVTALGWVDLPTGAVEVIDPMMYLDDPDSQETELLSDVPPGSYHVERSDSADGPLAVRVVFSDMPATRWELLDYAVCVDSANIAIVDRSALPFLGRLNDQELLAAVEATYDPGGEIKLGQRRFGPLKLGGVRMVVFGTGADGSYRCFWGIGPDGAKVSLIIDLGGLYAVREIGVRVQLADLRLGVITDSLLAASNIALEVVRLEEQELSLRVVGYDPTYIWELRYANGMRVNHGKLFQRHTGILTLSTPGKLPEDIHLFIGLLDGSSPMMPVDI